MRTTYFKTPNMEKSISFWQGVLEIAPRKKSDFWSEFRCDNINLGFLKIDSFEVERDKSNSIPVFEVSDDQFELVITRIKSLSATVVLDINDHPDGKSYVFADPFGHEFEVTKFHD